MSLILYNNNVLYADRAAVSSANELAYFTEISKLYIDKSKYFAMAFVGDEVDFSSDNFKAFIKLLKVKLHSTEHLDEASSCLKFPYDDMMLNPSIIITHNRVYQGKPDNCTNKDSLIKTDYLVLGYSPKLRLRDGTGQHSAEVGIILGLSDLDAAKLASKVCVAMYPTEIDTFKMSDLKPFPAKLPKTWV